MDKILKPYTIIPQDLYVQRHADKQLKNIIDDMGRPGYVLVSRQMGKTNLLLNAKRIIENENNIFVYVDLSTSYKNARSCFRNIIDTAVDGHCEEFAKASIIIKERRHDGVDLPPHKEHTNELRLLLNALNGGKLIIMLDEIDALTKTDYSDQIFAQIRSSYFASRVNYKEFYKLTYLLSGVIEPTEIIKDSKISPFNIGQKIYLNDFTKEEFFKFIKLSKLKLSKESLERVFYWTNGNPRMTWDVCSEIENKISSKKFSFEIIDVIINKIYLSTFDKPPIDNIRELVREDIEIRNAIFELNYGKEDAISDRIKNKLYLSGIINNDDQSVCIKNEIIKQSLGLDWIKSLEEEEKSYYRLALDEFTRSEYKKALAYFIKFTESNEFINKQHNIVPYYYMGSCALNLYKYSESLEYLEKCNFDMHDYPDYYYDTLQLKAYAYINQLNNEEAINCYKTIIEAERNDQLHYNSMLTYGSLIYKTGDSSSKEESLKYFHNFIDILESNMGKLDIDLVNAFKSYAYYQLAKIAVLDNYQFAIEYLEKAVGIAYDRAKPKMYLEIIRLSDDLLIRKKNLEKIIDLIIIGKISPEDFNPTNQFNFTYGQYHEIVKLCFLDKDQALLEIIKSNLQFKEEKLFGDHIYYIAMEHLEKDDFKTGIKILELLYQNINNDFYKTSDTTRFDVVKILLSYHKKEKSHYIYDDYIEMFRSKQYEKVDEFDIKNFVVMIQYFIREKKYDKALESIELICSIKNEVSEEHQINYLFVDYMKLLVYTEKNDHYKANHLAASIIKIANEGNLKKHKSSLFDEAGFDTILQNTKSYLSKEINHKPIKVEKKYKRNEKISVKYNNGTIQSKVKYKKVEQLIIDGECQIID